MGVRNGCDLMRGGEKRTICTNDQEKKGQMQFKSREKDLKEKGREERRKCIGLLPMNYQFSATIQWRQR